MEARETGELTVLIADDEPLARRRIAELLRGRRGVRVVGQCATGTATMDAVRELEPDVLFLDVQMPGLTGFEVLARLGPDRRPLVIFSTAYDEYALAAFEVHAVDYLLKPYADDRFEEAIARAERALRSERVDELHDRLRGLLQQVTAGTEGPAIAARGSATYLDRFAVPSPERVALIDAASVDWIEATGDYVSLHVGGKTHLLRGTMAGLEGRLDPRRFLRVHRSAIVQLGRIRHLRAGGHGAYFAVLEGGERVRVGRSYRDAVLERLGVRW